jgi:hypothetical protein
MHKKAKGDHGARVHIGKMVLMVVRQGGWSVESPKTLKGKLMSDFWQPWVY